VKTSSKSSGSVSRTKRTFPASSSAQSLASVGEEKVAAQQGDVSCLLPTSPTKWQHLMRPEHLLQNEELSLIASEGASMLVPSGSGRSDPPRQPTTVLPRTTPGRESPIKDADMTMDLKQMMAKMTKPKRESGGEMSFMDLLRGQHDELEEYVPLSALS
jgi:hypothetical protein